LASISVGIALYDLQVPTLGALIKRASVEVVEVRVRAELCAQARA
jgi:hypothetical protein